MEIQLTDYDDVFIGRDYSVDENNGYKFNNELVYASSGNDTVDGGGGYNTAAFYTLGKWT